MGVNGSLREGPWGLAAHISCMMQPMEVPVRSDWGAVGSGISMEHTKRFASGALRTFPRSAGSDLRLV